MRIARPSIVRRLGVAAATMLALGGAILAGGPAAVATTTAGTSSAAAAGSLGGDFLWGVASAGFQSEGYSPDSNWSRYAAGTSGYDPVGTSVDFLHRYRADIARAKALGVTVYRISVEWARVEPEPGVWDPSAWAYYDDVVQAIVEAGMRPMITLDHWVYPGWEADLGGWRRPAMRTDWLVNARKVVDRYASYDPLWVTFNEPVYYLVQEIRNGGLQPIWADRMLYSLQQDHNAIYDYIHAHQPDAMVTSNVAYIPSAEPVLDAMFLDKIAGRLDFLGLDYYYPVSATDWSALYAFTGESWKSTLAPEGIYYALRHYADAYPDLPLFVIENGMPTENGAPRADGYDRADNLRDTVYWLQRAKADGIDVIGYNYWSLTDNYEWGSYTPRFGLYTVDVLTDPTLTRHPTDAVAAYRQITADEGVPADYRPTRDPQFCSLVDFLDSCLDPVTVD